MKRLIVAADDFGLTRSVNEGIVRAHEEGVVTSINILPSGDSYDDALKLAGNIGLTEAGVHLCLTEIGPILSPDKIKSLIGRDGLFLKNNLNFFSRYFLGQINLDEVYLEWKAQLEKVLSSGLTITNLSSHEHIHMLRPLLNILIRLAGEYNIPAIRYIHDDISYRSFNISVLYKKMISAYFKPYMRDAIMKAGLTSPEHFLGFFDSGNLTEDIIIKIISGLGEGTTELVCHPGFISPEITDRYTFHKNSERELFALTSRRVKKAIEALGVKLLTYNEYLADK